MDSWDEGLKEQHWKKSRWLNIPETQNKDKLPAGVEEVPARKKTKE